MLDATRLPAIWLIVALALLCLSATGIVAWIFVRRMENLRRVTQERFEELNRKVRRIEARLGEQAEGPRTARTTGPSPPAPFSSRRPADRAPAPATSTLIAIPNLAATERPEDPQVESDLSQRHAEVWTLAATGSSPEEIARQTGQPVGEVELIVGLYRQIRSSRGSLDHARSV